MGKQGPCSHCGITSTPLWRNGPPEKPVLCNACGSRWRTKGSLANYTPLHAREPIEWEESKITKMKSISLKTTEMKLQRKRKMKGFVENVLELPFSESEQKYIRNFEGDASNRSSSGSAISYSESCADFDAVDASECTGSAQSNAWDSIAPVPSKKRTVVKFKPSSVEKLTKDLCSIWHEQQSSNLSGSSEEELLYEGEMAMGSDEIGHGGVLLRHPCSKTVEEESEASSVPVDNKFVRSASDFVDDDSKWICLSNPSIDRFKKPAAPVAQENAGRDRFSPENLDMLQNRDSVLRFTDLEDIISFEVFMKNMTNEEQWRLLKYLPSIDTAKPPESLRSLFSSAQFMKNCTYFQQLLQDGIFDLSSFQMKVEEGRGLKRLASVNFTKSRWVQRYKEMKDMKQKRISGVERGEKGTNFLRQSNLTPIKRPLETKSQQLQESKGAMSSKKPCKSSITKFSFTNSSVLNPTKSGSTEMFDAEGFSDDDATCFSPRSLFVPPPDRSSMLQFTEDSSDQDLLLDVRCGALLPEAELLNLHPYNHKTASNSASASGFGSHY